MSRNLPTPARALAIGAHPDDTEFGCAATFAKWSAAGCVTSYVICTDGAKGTWDPSADRAELVVTRQHEQRAAAKAAGSTGDVVFLEWPDGELDAGLRQRWQIAYWIRRLRPDVVAGHDPWKRYRLHPDHRAAGFLTIDGIVAARDPHFFPEQELAPHRPTSLLLFEADEPDHTEDVTGYGDAKLAALEAHRSQFESTMRVSGDANSEAARAELAAFGDKIRQRLRDEGAGEGFTEGEAFKLIGDL